MAINIIMPNLVWTAQQVPLGATVLFIPSGSDEPVLIDGMPVPLRMLYGGVPTRAKLYALPIEKLAKGAIRATSVDLSGFKEDDRFSPAHTYTPESAHVDGKYAVFDGQKRMLDERLKSVGAIPLEVAKAKNGLLYASSAFPFEGHQLSGNPAFEASLPFKDISDDRLVERINSSLQRIPILRQNEWGKTDLSGAEFDLTKLVEMLARRHRSTPSDFVTTFSAFGVSYLRQASLPASAQLVRTDKEDFNYAMPKVAVQA